MLRRMLVGALALAVSVSTAGAQTDSTMTAKGGAVAAPDTAKKSSGKAAAGMEQHDMVVSLDTAQGVILIRMRDDAAPKTCANFRKLVKAGFYDGTYFHRVIPGFMIQGGDPNTKNADPNDDGLGGPGYTV
ncbi:MAG: peptidylprolyl isomerase, partial [Candidatus Eiseniibacteriota bacterium]